MKNLLLVLLTGFITCITWSCEKVNSANNEAIVNNCNISSVEQLPWANTLISNKSSCQVYGGAKLYMYDFNGEKVFYFTNPASSLGICNQAVYTCSGLVVSSSWDEKS